MEKIDVKYFSDLGKAIIFQNRRLGIHFQLSEKRGSVASFFNHFTLSDEHLKALRKGIRDAQGIMALFGNENKKFVSLAIDKSSSPFSRDLLLSTGEVKEISSLKSLTFFDCTTTSLEALQDKLVAALKNGSYDAFLFTLSQEKAIDLIVQAVHSGELQEKEIEKRLMKILSLKCCF
jgi:hypothetical protein